LGREAALVGEYSALFMGEPTWILLKKRRRILSAGGLGLPPSFKKSHKIGGYRGLIKTLSALLLE
jgi:hypothetical protein